MKNPIDKSTLEEGRTVILVVVQRSRGLMLK